jgi:hypothetical protein
MAGDVEDPLLRIQRRALPAELGQRVDHPRRGLAHPGPERDRQADRTRADDRDVADLVEIGGERRGHDAGARSGIATPSSALSARSTEHDTHVNVGVSRFV